MKPLSPIAETWVLALGEESSLNSVFMLHDCVGERLTLRVVLKYGPCKFAKIPIFGCKLPFLCVLMENRQLMWIDTPRIFSLFAGFKLPLWGTVKWSLLISFLVRVVIQALWYRQHRPALNKRIKKIKQV